MSIQRFEVGPRMSQCVVHGNTVYTAGQVAQAARGASVAEQTRDILAAIDRLLQAAGTDKSKLLTANIWLADMATFEHMNQVWDAWVASGHTPARATVQARLAHPDYKVEIMVTAARA
jgi:enamine deaminase RidA (YjgF/YER057c/UK114 family)